MMMMMMSGGMIVSTIVWIAILAAAIVLVVLAKRRLDRIEASLQRLERAASHPADVRGGTPAAGTRPPSAGAATSHDSPPTRGA